jgi:hypothetical protein
MAERALLEEDAEGRRSEPRGLMWYLRKWWVLAGAVCFVIVWIYLIPSLTTKID